MLHEKHEQWLNNPSNPCGTKVLMLDVSEDILGNEGLYT